MNLEAVLTYPDGEGSVRYGPPANCGPIEGVGLMCSNIMLHATRYLAADRMVILTVYLDGRVLFQTTYNQPPEPRKPLYSPELLAQIEEGFR